MSESNQPGKSSAPSEGANGPEKNQGEPDKNQREPHQNKSGPEEKKKAAERKQASSSSSSRGSDKYGGGALHTEHGTTTIANSVVAKIASLATQEISGVQAMGKALSRTFGTLRAKVPGASEAESQGVSVEVGEREAAIDIDIVVEYGHSIVEVAEAIRENVIDRIEAMTGLEVVEVNVSVDDLYLEGSDDEDQGSRVE
jgi:uncharacterized alkaline shock family protein YloU